MEQQPQAAGGKFGCSHCGKQYPWKPQMAGKRAKCGCGATILVPQTAPPVPPQASAPVNPLDDEYDFAPAEQPAPPRRTAAVPAARQSAGGPAAGAGVGTLGYVSAPSRAEKYRRKTSLEEALTSKPRDVYLPYSLIVGGAVAMIAWAMHQLGVSTTGVMAVSIVAGVSTLLKTGIILGLALLFAPKLGISFGDFRTAVRKLVAVVVVSDAALLWAGTVMDAMGATRPGWISVREIVVQVVLAAAVISTLCHYLFDMDAEETGMFAVPLALISLVLGFVLKLVAVVVIAAALGGRAGGELEEADAGEATDAAGGAAAATTPPAATQPAPESGAQAPPADAAAGAGEPSGGADAAVPFGENDADRALMRHIRESSTVMDARVWSRRPASAGAPERQLVDALYAADANKVFLDFAGSRTKRPVKVYVELKPSSPAARAPLFKQHLAYRRDNQLEPDPQPIEDTGQRFLVFELKR